MQSAIYRFKKNLLHIRKYGSSVFDFILSYFYKNMIGCPSSLITRSEPYKNIEFDVTNRYVADLKFFLSSKDFTYKNFKIIEEPLVKVTLQKGTETNTLFGSAEMIQNKIDFLDFIISTKLKSVFQEYNFKILFHSFKFLFQ